MLRSAKRQRSSFRVNLDRAVGADEDVLKDIRLADWIAICGDLVFKASVLKERQELSHVRCLTGDFVMILNHHSLDLRETPTDLHVVHHVKFSTLYVQLEEIDGSVDIVRELPRFNSNLSSI